MVISLEFRKIAAAAPRQSRMPAMPSTAIANSHNLFPRRKLPHTTTKTAIATNEMKRVAGHFRVSNSPGLYFHVADVSASLTAVRSSSS